GIRDATVTGVQTCALPISDSAYQSLIRSRSITHQQQDENHADERNQSRENHNWIEGMSATGLAHIRKITDEFEGNDSPDACTGTAETADRCHGFAVVKVGWQHVRHGRETCIAKGCYGEKQGNQVQIGR